MSSQRINQQELPQVNLGADGRLYYTTIHQQPLQYQAPYTLPVLPISDQTHQAKADKEKWAKWVKACGYCNIIGGSFNLITCFIDPDDKPLPVQAIMLEVVRLCVSIFVGCLALKTLKRGDSKSAKCYLKAFFLLFILSLVTQVVNMFTFDSVGIADQVAENAEYNSEYDIDNEIEKEQIREMVIDGIYLTFINAMLFGAFIFSLCFFCAFKYYKATKRYETIIATGGQVPVNYVLNVPAQPRYGVQYAQPGSAIPV